MEERSAADKGQSLGAADQLHTEQVTLEERLMLRHYRQLAPADQAFIRKAIEAAFLHRPCEI